MSWFCFLSVVAQSIQTYGFSFGRFSVACWGTSLRWWFCVFSISLFVIWVSLVSVIWCLLIVWLIIVRCRLLWLFVRDCLVRVWFLGFVYGGYRGSISSLVVISIKFAVFRIIGLVWHIIAAFFGLPYDFTIVERRGGWFIVGVFGWLLIFICQQLIWICGFTFVVGMFFIRVLVRVFGLMFRVAAFYVNFGDSYQLTAVWWSSALFRVIYCVFPTVVGWLSIGRFISLSFHWGWLRHLIRMSIICLVSSNSSFFSCFTFSFAYLRLFWALYWVVFAKFPFIASAGC